MMRSGPSPASAHFALVLLHGRGAGARDILQFGEALALPDVAFLAPEAPGLTWWPTSFLAPTDQMAPYVTAGLTQIDSAIAGFRAAGLTLDRIGVLGFSQGGCLAMEYLARHGDGLGYGFALSAGLVGTADASTPADPALYGHVDKVLGYTADLGTTSVYASCHASDPHIPLKRFQDSAEELKRLGAAITVREKPDQGHGIDSQDVVEIRKLLNVTAD